MDLPDYFLIDLPPEAPLTPDILTAACQTLKRNRAQYLQSRTTASLAKSLVQLAECWLDPEFPFRKLALDLGPQQTPFSRETLEHGLDSFFSRWTAEAFEAWLVQEFGHINRLDGLTSTRSESREDRAAIARGPELITHITGGVIPLPVFHSILTGILVRSAQFIKCASGTSFLPRIFVHSLYDRENKLGACLELAEWPGGNAELEEALFAESACVTAMGSDETLNRIGQRMPSRTRWIGYGHRLSFGYVSNQALSGLDPRKYARHAARDVAAWDQLGCLSPHLIYVQLKGEVSPEIFAGMLAEELEQREASHPRGAISPQDAASISSRRHFYEVRAAHASDTLLWASPESTAWTVTSDTDIRFTSSCLNRFIHVKAVEDLDEALHGAEEIRDYVSTVGLGATDDEASELAEKLAHWGVPRICPLGEMQNPPLSWRHDGRPALSDLVQWSDHEF